MKKKLFFLLSLGIVIKLYYAFHLAGYIDGDPATIGLMAKDILSGKFNLFFYGQNYNGALEAWWLAPFIWLFGLKIYVLFIGMIGLYLVFLLTIYILGKLLKDEYIGLWSVAYCAVSTYPLLHNSVFPYGYHLNILVLGNLSLIIALLLDRDEKRIWLWILLGIISGLGFWNHFTILYYLAPVAVFLCVRHFLYRFRYYIICFVSFFISSLPFWIHNINTNFSSFHIRSGRPYRYYPIDISVKDTLKRFFDYHVAGILGIREFNVFGIIMWVIFIVSILIFLIKLNRRKLLFLLLLASIIGLSLPQKFFIISPKYCYFLAFYTSISVFFAYLVEWLNKKVRYSGFILLLFILLFNMSDFALSTSEGRHTKGDRKEYLEKSKNYRALFNFLDLNGINGVIADFYTVQALNFMTDKKIAGAELMNGRPPTDELVQGRNNLAIIDCIDFLKSSMDVMCKEYKTSLAGHYNIAYGFTTFGYRERSISPKDWKANASSNRNRARFGFDRNLDRLWSSRKDKSPGMYYTVDLGKKYKICKVIVINTTPYLNNYPAGYRIQVSVDGKKWDLVSRGKDAQPLFWSGPRIYWDYYNGRWEVIFKPVAARFIRIAQTDYGQWQWMINELFVYEYLKEEDFGGSLGKIYEYLQNKEIKFVYADFWLSARIREFSNGGIGTLRIVNECYPLRFQTSRLMNVDEKTTVIICRGEEEEIDRTLLDFGLPVDKTYFDNYVCYNFNVLNDWQKYFLQNQKCLYWLGISIAKTNLHIYSQILSRYGMGLESGGEIANAVNFYNKALEVFSRNNIALERLSNKDKRYLLKLKHLCQPSVRKNVEFVNGVKFLGYTLYRSGNKLRINYFWNLPRGVPKDTVVFVHFIKNGKLIFQNDHRLLENYPEPVIPLKDWIYVERYWVELPPDIEPGVYEIKLGLYMPSRKGERIKIIGTGLHRLTKADIGELVIPPLKTRDNPHISKRKYGGCP